MANFKNLIFKTEALIIAVIFLFTGVPAGANPLTYDRKALRPLAAVENERDPLPGIPGPAPMQIPEEFLAACERLSGKLDFLSGEKTLLIGNLAEGFPAALALKGARVTLVDNSLAELPVTDEKFDIIVASGDFFAGMAEEEKERTFARVFVLARNINCLVWIQDNPDWGNDLDLILSAGDACSAIGYRMSNDSLSEAVFPGEAVMKAYRVGKQISNPIVRSYYPVSSRLTDAFIALSNETRNITGTKDSELKELMIERNRKRTALAREVMVRFDPPSLIQAFLALQNLVSEEKQFEWEPLAFPVETGAPRSVIDHILGMGVISDADVALTLRNLTAHHEKHGIPRDKINGRFIRDHFDCAIEILLEGRADLSAIDQEMMNNIRRNLMDEVNSVIINALFEMQRQYEVNAVDDYFMRRAALREAQSQV